MGVKVMQRQGQLAYDSARIGSVSRNLTEKVYSAMYNYLVEDLGRDPSWSHDRATAEAEGRLATRFCDELEQTGVCIRNQRILDLGTGLGGVATELARRGGSVIAIEPGHGWRAIAARRLAEVGHGAVLG